MPFQIIKKGQPVTQATPPPEKPPSSSQPPKPQRPVRKEAVAPRREPMLFGVVGQKVHKDGTVELLRSSVPESEASPWLKAENQQRNAKKGP